ncbi:MAG: DciA family protein [Cyanobacteria bacterium P01_G01_bin.19]
MDLNSVETILRQLEQQPGWEKFREYRLLLDAWKKTVNSNTVKYTRPLYINRQILWVAADSASRAQELSFQRYTLLKRLNKQLSFNLKDIRFSASNWHQTNYQSRTTAEIIFPIARQHKRQKPKNNLRNASVFERDSENISDRTDAKSKAREAARRWLNKVSDTQQGSSTLQPCPSCQALTPIREIERWNCCYLCIAKKWSKEYRSPTFPE